MAAKVTDLLNTIEAIAARLGQNGEFLNGDVVTELRAKHAKAVKAVSSQLEDLTLHRMVGQALNRKRNVAAGNAADLFGEYSGIPHMVKVKTPGGYANKRYGLQSINAAKARLAELRQRQQSESNAHDAELRFLNDLLDKGMDGETTIDAAIDALAIATTAKEAS